MDVRTTAEALSFPDQRRVILKRDHRQPDTNRQRRSEADRFGAARNFRPACGWSMTAVVAQPLAAAGDRRGSATGGNRSFRDRRDPGSEFNNFGKPVARKSSSKRGGLCLKHVPPRHVRLVLRLTYDGDAVNNRWRKVLLLRDARYGKTPVLGILKSDSPGGLPVRRIHPPLKLLHGLELQY